MGLLVEVVRRFGLCCHQYAADTQFNLTLDTKDAVESLNTCLEVIMDWMTINKLKLNWGKMEALLDCHNSTLESGISPVLGGIALTLKRH